MVGEGGNVHAIGSRERTGEEGGSGGDFGVGAFAFEDHLGKLVAPLELVCMFEADQFL